MVRRRASAVSNHVARLCPRPSFETRRRRRSSESDSKSRIVHSGPCEPAGQEPEMSGEKPSRLGSGGTFEIFCEAPASAEPSKRALDNPAPRQELEPLDAWRSLNDLDRPGAGKCIDELFAAINSVCEDMPQLGKAVVHALQHGDGAMDILNVGGMNVHGQQQTVGIGNDVALAPMEALAGVKAARTTGLCRRSCLAMNAGRRWLRLAAKLAPSSPDQDFDDPLPPAGVAPCVKIALYRGVRRKFLRQSPPLAAGGQNVENCLHDLTQINCPRS